MLNCRPERKDIVLQQIIFITKLLKEYFTTVNYIHYQVTQEGDSPI